MSLESVVARRHQLTFVYDHVTIDDHSGTVSLAYRVDGAGEPYRFTEHVTLPGAPTDAAAQDAVLTLLWLAAGLSYYKVFAPATVSVPAGLTPAQRTYLTALLRHGLAEFAYVNDLPDALTPRVDAPDLPAGGGGRAGIGPAPASALVPVGGGKDSVDTIETLREAGVDVTLFSVNRHPAIDACIERAGLPAVHAARGLDRQVLDLNTRGALNGHVPVTAINSCIAVLSALRLGLHAVAFSNERSASYGNVRWHDEDVNHQWSKSLAAEVLLRDALADARVPVQYFSLLRPLTEISIARRFAGLRQYHDVFTSCNRAYLIRIENRAARWCGNCPKCRFVFLMLAAFLPPQDVLAVFGTDMFADPAQRDGFAELLGLGDIKPLECVGEPDECVAAWQLVRSSPAWADHPFVRADFDGAVPDVPDGLLAQVFDLDPDHVVPADLEKVLRAVH